MHDQGYNLEFNSKGCDLRKAGSRKLVTNANGTLINVYFLDELKEEKCCMVQADKNQLWNRMMGHIKFDNLVKLSKTQEVRDMPRISKPMETNCKPCQHKKQTRVQSH